MTLRFAQLRRITLTAPIAAQAAGRGRPARRPAGATVRCRTTGCAWRTAAAGMSGRSVGHVAVGPWRVPVPAASTSSGSVQRVFVPEQHLQRLRDRPAHRRGAGRATGRHAGADRRRGGAAGRAAHAQARRAAAGQAHRRAGAVAGGDRPAGAHAGGAHRRGAGGAEADHRRAARSRPWSSRRSDRSTPLGELLVRARPCLARAPAAWRWRARWATRWSTPRRSRSRSRRCGKLPFSVARRMVRVAAAAARCATGGGAWPTRRAAPRSRSWSSSPS